MKYAILSDIHGNLEALESVLAELRKHKVEKYIFLGDVVGYGANPNECLELLQSLNPLAVLGNHDAAVCGLTDLGNFTALAYQAIVWTRQELEPAGREYLASLPLVRTFGEITIFHSNLVIPDDWRYIQKPQESYSSFANLSGRFAFFGHSHRPVIYRKDGQWIDYLLETETVLSREWQYMINVGSVGQPRDRDSRASFGIFDDESGELQIIRVKYPIRKAQKKIRAAGLPKRLATRLAEGK
ncbi:MAG: metallophosphoesterase family protein [Candidatus Auribacterota bacterium]|nr:metallophosphoesterase family protein [Candidatus Auribacterota bacterium]